MPVGRPVDPDQQLRTVSARGEYDAARQVLVRQREVNSQAGFLVVTPLRTTSGATLFVVRGFLANQVRADQVQPAPAPPHGTVSIVGRARPSGPSALPTSLPPGHVPSANVPD